MAFFHWTLFNFKYCNTIVRLSVINELVLIPLSEENVYFKKNSKDKEVMCFSFYFVNLKGPFMLNMCMLLFEGNLYNTNFRTPSRWIAFEKQFLTTYSYGHCTLRKGEIFLKSCFCPPFWNLKKYDRQWNLKSFVFIYL